MFFFFYLPPLRNLLLSPPVSQLSLNTINLSQVSSSEAGRTHSAELCGGMSLNPSNEVQIQLGGSSQTRAKVQLRKNIFFNNSNYFSETTQGRKRLKLKQEVAINDYLERNKQTFTLCGQDARESTSSFLRDTSTSKRQNNTQAAFT